MLKLTVKYSGAIPGVTFKRGDLNRAKKLAYGVAGIHWHRQFRPKHFTKRGATEYAYKKRKGEAAGRGTKAFWRSYTGQKQRRKGHTLPLVYSGLSRTLSRQQDVRATSRGMKVVLHTPGLNRQHPKSQIDMRREMTKVSLRERDKLVSMFDRSLDRQIKRHGRTRTKKM